MDFILKNELRITGWSYYNASLEERGLLPEEWADGEEHEEEDEDYRIDAGNQETNPQHTEFLRGKRWKGLRTAKVVEEELKSVKGILTRSNSNIRIFDVKSWICQTIHLHRFVESNP